MCGPSLSVWDWDGIIRPKIYILVASSHPVCSLLLYFTVKFQRLFYFFILWESFLFVTCFQSYVKTLSASFLMYIYFSFVSQIQSLITTLIILCTAVETFPRFDTATMDDKTRRMLFSCLLRFIQGSMAIFSSFVLVVNSSNVIEIILNFTAVNFISNIDGKNTLM